MTAATVENHTESRPPIPADHPSVVTAKKMHADETLPVTDMPSSLNRACAHLIRQRTSEPNLS